MVSKYLGNSYHSTGDRVFIHVMLDGKQVHRLVTWSQRRCEKCQRFLNKHQQKYCASCVKIVEKERSLNRKEERLLRGKIYWSPNRFNVGDYV